MTQHNFKKKFGQNFISDKNLLNAICLDGEVSKEDEVLEIGAGMGSLTSALSKHAKKVVSYEIDKDLNDHLLSLQLENVEFVFGDVMDYSLMQIENSFEGGYKMVANLPYYITSPIIFKFLKSDKLKSLTIMVQKEVAERIVAQAGDHNYGVLSIMTAFYGRPQIKRIVSKKLFYPEPNVDSAIVNIKVERNGNEKIDDEKFYKFICSAFAMRRKTLKNNLLKGGISHEKINSLSADTLAKRPEDFNLTQFVEIYLKLFG